MMTLQKVILCIAAVLWLAGCAPGSSVQVTTPGASVQLWAPGPNPMLNQPDPNGRIAQAGAGLWHGLIAPITLLISFFNPAVRMYEVHNAGSEYDLGFALGLAVVFLIVGLLFRLRR